MENETMGRVVVTARIENMEDLYDVKKGVKTPDQVRFVEVDNAIAGTGSFTLTMPTSMIATLGLDMFRPLWVLPARESPATQTRLFEAVKLTIQGRECPTEVVEFGDAGTIVIGRILVEAMGWVIDPMTNTLVDDPVPHRPLMYEPHPTDPNPASDNGA